MKIFTLTLFLLIFNCFSQEKETIKYNYGVGVGHDRLKTTTKNKDVNYFTSNYSNGTYSSLLFKNTLSLDKWRFSFDGGLGFIYQKQNLVFSNAIDPIIDFDVTHIMAQWQFNFGLSRQFDISNNAKLNFELGVILNGFFKKNTPVSDLNGSFESAYISNESFGQDNSNNKTYDYRIGYNGNAKFSPCVKIGLISEFNKRDVEFGVSYMRELVKYGNFIIIKSTSYTAISNSNSKSNTLGIYFNWFFRK
jgi:hypothetical protein